MRTDSLEMQPGRYPSDEPEVEILRGIELPKMSPKRRHGRLQWAIAGILDTWAGDDGEVACEWRFRFPRTDKAYAQTSLVPDVAFVRAERMRPLSDLDAEEPPFAPDIAVEIRSAGDRESNIRIKIREYLENGARLVLDIDPVPCTIVAHDQTGECTFRSPATFEHREAPGLSFDVEAFFAKADRKR
jgi:Uma2 family endonuclease